MILSIARRVLAWKRFVAAALLAPLVVLLVAQRASAGPPYVIDDPARPSPIAISASYRYLASGVPAVCVVFVNHGATTATAAVLSLALADAAGNVLGVDVLRPRGRFFVDKESGYSGSVGFAPFLTNGNCEPLRTVNGPDQADWWYETVRGGPKVRIAAIVVSAREVRYQDGTMWKNDQVPQTGDHVNLPNLAPPDGPLRSEAFVPDGAPVAFTDVYEQDSAPARSAIPQSLVRTTCVTFVNHDERAATLVRTGFVFLDASGTILGVQTHDTRGTFSKDVPIETSRGGTLLAPNGNCVVLDGRRNEDGTYGYAAPGGGTPAAAARLVVMPLEVDFAGGSSWQAANPPRTGGKLTAP